MYIADIKDASVSTINEIFEAVGHPEYYFDKMLQLDSVELDQEYDIYDYDEITVPDVVSRIDIDNVEPIGTFRVVSRKYVIVDGTVDLD
jgi:hypothetical protein